MKYLEVKLTASPNEAYVYDLLAAYLGDIEFESFQTLLKIVHHTMPQQGFLLSLVDQIPFWSFLNILFLSSCKLKINKFVLTLCLVTVKLVAKVVNFLLQIKL